MKNIILIVLVSAIIAIGNDPNGYIVARWGMDKETVISEFAKISKKVSKAPAAYKPLNALFLQDIIGSTIYTILFSFDEKNKLQSVYLWPGYSSIRVTYSTLVKEWPVLFANLEAKYGKAEECSNLDKNPFVDREIGLRSGRTKIECRWEFETTTILLRVERDLLVKSSSAFATGVASEVSPIEAYKSLLEYRRKENVKVTPGTGVQDNL